MCGFRRSWRIVARESRVLSDGGEEMRLSCDAEIWSAGERECTRKGEILDHEAVRCYPWNLQQVNDCVQ